MERISRAEIESSVDSFPDMDYKFEHIDWADIMDAEDASNPEMKLDILQQKSYSICSDLFRSTKSQSGLPSLNSLKLDDHSRGLPPLDTKQLRGVNNGSVPKLVSFSGVLNRQKVENNNTNITIRQLSVNKAPAWRNKEIFKIPALPIQMGKRSLEQSSPTERKTVRLPHSPSSLHDNKRLKISEHCYHKNWRYGNDDFTFTSDLDWTANSAEPFRLPIPHSPSVSTLESDTELETSSAFSDTSSTSTLTGKHSKNREELPLITDPHKLEQRQKQLDYGKNTEGYKNYIKLWSKFSRRPGMPQTPDKTIGYSHRRWLGLMTKWRKALHKWDTLDNAPAPKSKEFHIHLEDANTFPTLPLGQVAPGTAAETQAQFSYSVALQNLLEDIELSPQQQQQPANVIQNSTANTNVPVCINQFPHMTGEPPSYTNPLTYSSVLKAPISVQRASVPPQEPENKLVSTEDKVTTASEEGEDKSASPPPKPTYSQVLTSPKPVNPPLQTNDSSEKITPESTAPTSSPVILAISSVTEDSMEVDMPSHSPKETMNENFNSQPLSYSQALRSKPPVHPATIDISAVETVNELSNNCREVEKSAEINSDDNPNMSGPTYSQVLAGRTMDRPETGALSNGPSQDPLISNQIRECSPEETGYNCLAPQSGPPVWEKS